jgi:hypothetical protein
MSRVRPLVECAPPGRSPLAFEGAGDVKLLPLDISHYFIVNDRRQANLPKNLLPAFAPAPSLREGVRATVELIGIEPTTSGLQSQRSPN